MATTTTMSPPGGEIVWYRYQDKVQRDRTNSSSHYWWPAIRYPSSKVACRSATDAGVKKKLALDAILQQTPIPVIQLVLPTGHPEIFEPCKKENVKTDFFEGLSYILDHEHEYGKKHWKLLQVSLLKVKGLLLQQGDDPLSSRSSVLDPSVAASPPTTKAMVKATKTKDDSMHTDPSQDRPRLTTPVTLPPATSEAQNEWQASAREPPSAAQMAIEPDDGESTPVEKDDDDVAMPDNDATAESDNGNWTILSNDTFEAVWNKLEWLEWTRMRNGDTGGIKYISPDGIEYPSEDELFEYLGATFNWKRPGSTKRQAIDGVTADRKAKVARREKQVSVLDQPLRKPSSKPVGRHKKSQAGRVDKSPSMAVAKSKPKAVTVEKARPRRSGSTNKLTLPPRREYREHFWKKQPLPDFEEQVWPILETLGFQKTKVGLALPKAVGRNRPSVFQSARGLRYFLCRYGVPGIDDLDSQSRQLVEHSITFAGVPVTHSNSLEKLRKINFPESDELRECLQEMGFEISMGSVFLPGKDAEARREGRRVYGEHYVNEDDLSTLVRFYLRSAYEAASLLDDAKNLRIRLWAAVCSYALPNFDGLPENKVLQQLTEMEDLTVVEVSDCSSDDDTTSGHVSTANATQVSVSSRVTTKKAKTPKKTDWDRADWYLKMHLPINATLEPLVEKIGFVWHGREYRHDLIGDHGFDTLQDVREFMVVSGVPNMDKLDLMDQVTMERWVKWAHVNDKDVDAVEVANKHPAKTEGKLLSLFFDCRFQRYSKAFVDYLCPSGSDSLARDSRKENVHYFTDRKALVWLRGRKKYWLGRIPPSKTPKLEILSALRIKAAVVDEPLETFSVESVKKAMAFLEPEAEESESGAWSEESSVTVSNKRNIVKTAKPNNVRKTKAVDIEGTENKTDLITELKVNEKLIHGTTKAMEQERNKGVDSMPQSKLSPSEEPRQGNNDVSPVQQSLESRIATSFSSDRDTASPENDRFEESPTLPSDESNENSTKVLDIEEVSPFLKPSRPLETEVRFVEPTTTSLDRTSAPHHDPATSVPVVTAVESTEEVAMGDDDGANTFEDVACNAPLLTQPDNDDAMPLTQMDEFCDTSDKPAWSWF